MYVIHNYLQFTKPPQNNARSFLSVASLWANIYSFKETSTSKSTRIETIKQLSKAKLELNTPTSRSWKSLSI